MKKIFIMLLAMLFCAGVTYAWDFQVDGISYSITKQATEESLDKLQVGQSIQHKTMKGVTSTLIDEVVQYYFIDGAPNGYGIEEIANLIDGNSSTKWCCSFDNRDKGTTDDGGYIIFEASRPMAPSYYVLTTANDTQSFPGRSWKQWQIYGMNADTPKNVTRSSEDWVLLDEKANIELPAANYASSIFTLSEEDTTQYKYFKIEIDQIVFSGTMQMSEFALGDDYTKNVEHIAFEDANVKALCVANWDTNNDGELSMGEAASVTSLGKVFQGTTIRVFRELQFFTDLTSIDEQAFEQCKGLVSITIPNSVKSIGNYAFNGCQNLATINLPIGLMTIGEYAFSACKALNFIIIPEGVTTIGAGAFSGCQNLILLNIPESLTGIGENTFSGCSSLTIYIVGVKDPLRLDGSCFPNRETSILYVPTGCKEAYSAAGYWSEFEKILDTSPYISFEDANVKAICVSKWDTDEDNELSFSEAMAVTSLSWIFDGNTSIRSFDELQFFTGITSINNNAFSNCKNLTSIIIPNSVKSIGNYAFKNCTSLSSVSIPNTVLSIGESAFSGCSSLNSIVLSNQLEFIGESAFQGCPILSSITIPSCITSIGKYAFKSCYKLKNVNIIVTDYSEFCNNHIIRQIDYQYRYYMHDYSSYNMPPLQLIDVIGNEITEYTIPKGITIIGDSAFYYCSGLTSITIPNSVTSIGEFAFWECSGLTSITIPNSVTSIGYAAFAGCNGLSSIRIPNSVTSIGSFAFAGCNGLSSAKIGNGVISIGDGAFNYCENLSSVIMGNNVKSIGSSFSNCCNLTSIILPDMLESIGHDAFTNTSLTFVHIPGSVKTIGGNAFKDCGSLASVSFEDGLTSIGDGAFQKCALTAITIPNSVTTIGGAAFANNSKLTTAILGDGITEIKAGTFEYCPFLSSVVIPDGVTNIGGKAFERCYSLTSIRLPESLASMEEPVFKDCPLKSIELPNSFTTISDNLFFDNHFQYIKLGNNLKSIGKNAFGSYGAVIEIGTSTPPTIASDAFPNVEFLADLNVIVPNAAAENAYRKATVWQEMTFSNQNNISEVTVDTPGDLSFELITECNMMPAKVVGLKVNGTINADDFNQMLVNMKSLLRLDLSDCNITEIPDGALSGKAQLQEIILPTSLQTIGKSAFEGCQYLTGELNLPSTLTSVGESAFVGTAYTSVSLPNTLMSIGDYAFNNIPIKQPLVLPGSVNSVGVSAFEGTKIESLSIPRSVTIVGSRAFANTQIKSLTIKEGVKSIGDGAFAGTPIQGHVTIPDGVIYLGSGAFKNSQLSTVFLPNSITTLGEGLFQGCPNLDIVYIPDNFTAMSNYAFDGCGALSSLRLSANTVTMGEYSLQNTPLEYVRVPSPVEVLPCGVLKNCKNLESLSLPANLKSVEAEALTGCTALRNLSVEAVTPPVIKDRSAIRGINTDLCLISIPTQSYRAYVLAEYWGQFVQMRNDIAVETEGDGKIAFESVDEEEEEEEYEVREYNGLPAPAHARRHTPEYAEDEDSLTFVNSGSSVYVPQQGKVRFYIIPAEGAEILSATLDGEDIMPYIVDGVYVATADKRNAKLVVVFSGSGQGTVVQAGDVNGDGEVSVTDVGCVINYILEQIPEPFIYAAADMNGDEDISVTDVGYIINYILNDGFACRAEQKAAYSYGEPVLTANTNGYTFALDGADAFIGFQMDIFVPEGADGCNVQLTGTGTDHQMVCRRLGNGHYRMVCYSPYNETFQEGLTDLLTFATSGNMTVSNIRFTTEGLNEVRFADMSATPTSIANVTDLKSTDIRIYTLEGQLYRTVHVRPGENPLKDLKPGVYLINERKYIVR